MPETQQQWLSERQAARRLGASLVTVKRWREAGVGPPVVQLGARMFRYNRDQLDAWAEQRSVFQEPVA